MRSRSQHLLGSNSDHNVLSWNIECTANKVYNNRTKLCFNNKADHAGVRYFVNGKLQIIQTLDQCLRAPCGINLTIIIGVYG